MLSLDKFKEIADGMSDDLGHVVVVLLFTYLFIPMAWKLIPDRMPFLLMSATCMSSLVGIENAFLASRKLWRRGRRIGSCVAFCLGLAALSFLAIGLFGFLNFVISFA